MSILYFKPTFGYKDTGQNVRNFVHEHSETLWDIFKPLMPFIAIFTLLDLAITQLYMPIDPETGEKQDFGLFSIIANYFLACFIITWHRVIIHGPDSYNVMRPFKPDRAGLKYIFGFFAIIVAGILAGFVGGLIVALLKLKFLALPIFAVLIIGVLYVGLRVSFYFPAAALGNPLSFKEAFKLSDGYALHILVAPIFAIWKFLLMFLGYILASFAIIFVIILTTGGPEEFVNNPLLNIIVNFTITLPIVLYFTPILAAYGVTVLSNYYQHALQNTDNLHDKIEKAEDEAIDKILDDPYGHDLDDTNDKNKNE